MAVYARECWRAWSRPPGMIGPLLLPAVHLWIQILIRTLISISKLLESDVDGNRSGRTVSIHDMQNKPQKKRKRQKHQNSERITVRSLKMVFNFLYWGERRGGPNAEGCYLWPYATNGIQSQGNYNGTIQLTNATNQKLTKTFHVSSKQAPSWLSLCVIGNAIWCMLMCSWASANPRCTHPWSPCPWSHHKKGILWR